MNRTKFQNSRRFATAVTVAAIAVPFGFALAAPANAATTTTATATMLQEMAAEEKLSHDVYVTLGNIFDVSTFDRISSSELRHQAALRTLMATYGVTDLTAGDAVGTFDDPAVQKLYNDLIAAGSVSIAAAAQAGITVEKLDMADLDVALAANPAADITRVLEILRSGSVKHLAAFERLATDGATCAPAANRGPSAGPGAGRWR